MTVRMELANLLKTTLCRHRKESDLLSSTSTSSRHARLLRSRAFCCKTSKNNTLITFLLTTRISIFILILMLQLQPSVSKRSVSYQRTSRQYHSCLVNQRTPAWSSMVVGRSVQAKIRKTGHILSSRIVFLNISSIILLNLKLVYSLLNLRMPKHRFAHFSSAASLRMPMAAMLSSRVPKEVSADLEWYTYLRNSSIYIYTSGVYNHQIILVRELVLLKWCVRARPDGAHN